MIRYFDASAGDINYTLEIFYDDINFAVWPLFLGKREGEVKLLIIFRLIPFTQKRF